MLQKKIGISGYYGMDNFGDDLFAITSYLGVKKYWQSYNPYVISSNFDKFSVEYNNIPLLPESFLSREDACGKITRLCNLAYNSIMLDKIIFAGGSIFSSGHADSKKLAFFLRSKNNKYFSALGISVGPFENTVAEKNIKKQLEKFEFISVRDEISFMRLRDFQINAKITLAADLVGLLPLLIPGKPIEVEQKNENKNKFILGFSPCHIENSTETGFGYCDSFVRMAVKLAAIKNIEVYIICLNVVKDKYLCDYAQRQLVYFGVKSKIISRYSFGIFGIYEIISKLNFYSTVRLHGAIVAYLNKTPFYLYEYHEKCSEFLKFIGADSDKALNYIDEEFDAVIYNVQNYKISPIEFAKLSMRNFTEAPF
jgi:polysaccharide pyruvyl transferase WcaK-like protein